MPDLSRPPSGTPLSNEALSEHFSTQHDSENDQTVLLEALIDLTPNALFITDLNGLFTQVNAYACQLLGYSQAEFLSKTIADLIPPEDFSRLIAAQEILAVDTPQVSTWIYLHKDGTPIPTEVRAKVLPDGRWMAVVRDLRESLKLKRDRNRAEIALCEKEQPLYGASTDSHEHKLIELNEQFLSELDLRLRQLSDANAMVWEAVSRVGEYLNVDRCVWHEVNLAEDLSVVEQDWRRHPDIPSVVGIYRLSEFLLPELIQHYQAGHPAAASDVAIHPYTAPFAQNYAQRGIRAFAGVPCIYEGRWVAMLAVNDRTVREWRADEVALLQETVSRLWSIIEQTRAVQALQEQTNHIQLLYETTRDLLSTHQPLTLIEALFAKLKSLVGLDVFLNYVLEEKRQQLHLMFHGGISDDTARQIEWLDVDCAICGTVAQRRYQVLQFDVQHSVDPKTQLVRSLGITAYAIQPLIAQGKLFGTLSFGSRTRTTFTPTETELFQVLCDQIAIALERSQLVDSLKHQTEELQQNNRLKDEFFSALSHELRTPLNPILGWTKMLQTQKLPPDKVVYALQTVERNVQQQIRLVDDLLHVSCVIQGKMRLETHPVDLASTLKTAIETVEFAAKAKAITLRLKSKDLIYTLGNGDRLQQVFWNLLSNAIKFTPEGGQVDIELAVENGHSSQYAEVRVTDTGIGISPEFLPHIFEYFRQAEGGITRSYGGLGLGLALVRHLVELHGGSVTAKSLGLGQGSILTVKLPLLYARPPFEQISLSSQQPVFMSNSHLYSEESTLSLSPKFNAPKLNTTNMTAQSSDQLANVCILLVDDEPDNLELMQFILNEEGATVLAFTSPLEALKAIAQSPPNLVLSDIGMPEMNGYEFIQRVRALPIDQGGKVPAIALTAFAQETDQQRAIAAGYQAYIAKPIDPHQVVLTIAQWVS